VVVVAVPALNAVVILGPLLRRVIVFRASAKCRPLVVFVFVFVFVVVDLVVVVTVALEDVNHTEFDLFPLFAFTSTIYAVNTILLGAHFLCIELQAFVEFPST
jgi:hypothetical protein